MMKILTAFTGLTFLLAASAMQTAFAGEENCPAQRKVHHLVIVWLKKHGDEKMRQHYIENSQRLAKLPGVISYHIGTPAQLKRETPNAAVDESYDIAISSTFANQQALENYSKHAEHQRIIQEVLKPLVEKYKVYDFVE